ncbi:MAG: MotA/TolQ/ExbB proton channel family protein [Pseudomonadota bacterium]
MLETLNPTLTELQSFLAQGGPAIWVIAALSVATLALILWKVWRLMVLGAWAGRTARASVELWCHGDQEAALRRASEGRGMRSRVVLAALRTQMNSALPEAHAREETARVAQQELARARSGLRALELIATIAPLIGLLGTVLGMIAAFQALQEAGARADPAVLAGGIWEALLTTAAGMTVAIPASAALTWFESVADNVQHDLEDAATRIFTVSKPDRAALAAAAA